LVTFEVAQAEDGTLQEEPSKGRTLKVLKEILVNVAKILNDNQKLRRDIEAFKAFPQF